MRIRNHSRQILPKIIGVMMFGVIAQSITNGYAQNDHSPQSVAIVSNLGGVASISSPTRGISTKEVALQGALVYGDRIETAQNSILSMLVGEGALVSMEELSQVSLEQTPDFPNVIHLMRGTTCFSTKKQVSSKEAPAPVRTPTTMVYPKPGSMFRVTVTNALPQEATSQEQPQKILTVFPSEQPLRLAQMGPDDARQQIETIEVIHGSVEIVSQVAGVSPVTVYEGFTVDVKDGVIGRPRKGSGVLCQIQDLQKDPQHIDNPQEIQQAIAQSHSTQATGLIAALFTPETTATPQESNERNPIISTTERDSEDLPLAERTQLEVTPPLPPGSPIPPGSTVTPDVPGENLVQIVGPNPVEINTNTLALNNSGITNDGTNNINSLVSVSSGGTLRGTSTDPILSLQGSQTTTQAAVTVFDNSVLEASAPLLQAVAANGTGSALTTTGEAVRIAGNQSQLVGFIPADALGLIELDRSNLTATGALFDVSNQGTLAVNGNLVALSRGSQLDVGNLVELSGGSSFGLAGGSLLFGDGSSTATINNTLCAGGNCSNGFIFSQGNNTINVDPNFQPANGVNISPDAALIVVRGSQNTVDLRP